MDKKSIIKKHNRSLAGKIVITCLLACGAIFLSLYISRVTFGKILSTVDQLSEPNKKIQLVNALFRDVVKLDLLQRKQALKTEPLPYALFIKESDHVQGMLDSLRNMSLQNPMQVARIDSMKDILNKKDQLFIKYVNLRTNLVQNDTLAGQVKNLSEMIEKTRLGVDSNLQTTVRATKTTIDTLKQEEEKQSLWKRIFVKKKAHVQQVQKKVEEVLNVRVDTVRLGNKSDSLQKIGHAISQVETNRLSRRAELLNKHAELNMAGDQLISQMFGILDDIEHDELAHDASQNELANTLVSNGLKNISGVLVIFVVGICVLIVLIFSDISRSNKYRKELILAKEEAEEAGLVKQRFLANMSHELRTPLQTIIGISEQVKDIAEPRQQDLENLHLSSLHLLQIVNEVLDYSRIISGKYILEYKPFNMYDLLAEVKEMIQVQLELKNLTLHYDIDIASDGWYSGDAFRLKQVLLNLLGNAVKFTPAGSVSLTAQEHKMPGSSTFTFTISDTGIGIAAEDMAIIFNEFEQAGNFRKRQGTGLGLSIVKAIVDIQHGTINAESEPGKGTTFTMTLPYTATDAIPEESAILADLSAYRGHIWLVDDDVFILQLCDSILRKYNIPHTCFSSAHEALHTPFPANLNIVFLDIRMGEMDGITLCNLLKERTVEHPPKYIALTAQAFADEQEAILQKGFDGLVVKPFLEQDLINAVVGHAINMENEPAIIDLSAVRKMTGDNDDILRTVLQSFIKETEDDVNTAKQSYERNESNELAEALHKLAGRCGQLGASALAHKLRTMEIALHNHEKIDTVMADSSQVYTDIEAMIANVKSLLINDLFPTNC